MQGQLCAKATKEGTSRMAPSEWPVAGLPHAPIPSLLARILQSSLGEMGFVGIQSKELPCRGHSKAEVSWGAGREGEPAWHWGGTADISALP